VLGDWLSKSLFIDLCMVNARIKGVSPGDRASPSIINHARVNRSLRKKPHHASIADFSNWGRFKAENSPVVCFSHGLGCHYWLVQQREVLSPAILSAVNQFDTYPVGWCNER